MNAPSNCMRARLAVFAAVVISIAAAAAPQAALAQNVTVSSNWSGYAVTGPSKGYRFHRVAGSWVQPRGTCAAGRETFSVAWVGLGGFNRGSTALEQAGTAVDCSRSGHALYSAWYELIPASPVKLRLRVHPGDRIAASVAERAHRTILQVRDLSTGAVKTAVRRLVRPDLSSAEWIVEAPSICSSSARCTPLPLTDFGTIAFSRASLRGSASSYEAIDARSLRVTRLELRDYSDGPLWTRSQGGAAHATGIASALSASGDAFTVTWQALTGGAEGSPPPQQPSSPPPRSL
jgi:Peptidase A4 family